MEDRTLIQVEEPKTEESKKLVVKRFIKEAAIWSLSHAAGTLVTSYVGIITFAGMDYADKRNEELNSSIRVSFMDDMTVIAGGAIVATLAYKGTVAAIDKALRDAFLE